jgi:hypothetical protein
MTIRRNAVVAALVVAVVIFIGVIVAIIAARVPVLAALTIAVVTAAFCGGAVLVAVSRSSSEPPIALASPAPDTPDPPLPQQYQAQSIAGVPLPSAHEDYTFTFSATVCWLPIVASVAEPGVIAVSEIMRRAREITRRRDPAQAVLITHELASLLADARPDPASQVHARAESVQLQLSADDQRRLEELARLRKEEELWDYQRRHEQNKRRYLGEDVLKDTGSAVVWWLARNDDQPMKVAENIGALTQLAHAANNADGNPLGNAAGTGDKVPASAPGNPQTSAERFVASIDSLGSLGDDARLTLTKQIASLVEGYGFPGVAEEMNRQYDEWPDGTASGVRAVRDHQPACPD